MSARGVTAQELPENQDESVAGVVQNEILHGHVRPAAAMQEGEAPAVAAVDAFTASLEVDTTIPEGFDNPEEPEAEEDVVAGDGSGQALPPIEGDARNGEPLDADGNGVFDAVEQLAPAEDQSDAAGTGE